MADFIFKAFVFYKNAAAYYLTMGPKKGRRVRKIEVPTDSVPEFELGETAADILRRRQDRERPERRRKHSNSNRAGETMRKEARGEETHSQEEGVAKKPRTEKSDTETEAV